MQLIEEVAERTWAAVQRARAEEALRRSEETFRTLFNNIDEGFCLIDLLYDEAGNPVDLRYTLTNPVFVRQTGMGDATGRTAGRILKDADPLWLKVYHEVIQTGRPARFESFSKGTGRWYNVFASRIGDESKNRLAIVFDDITERKQNEQRKNDFISMVSHELKTPLTSLKAHLQLVGRQAATERNTFTAGAMDKSLGQVGKMEKLIQGFLDVARLEEGKIKLSFERFDIVELISETIADFRLTRHSHQLVFLPPPPIFAYADRDKIGQVLHNLLSNAVKYSAKGTKVEITCETSTRGIGVSVTDEGIGIKPEDIHKVFERFQRIEDPQVRHISGFGIGLYLCSEIIRHHKGEISAESTLGKGSSFRFTIPLSD